jgi:nitrogen fixation protein FixH
MNAATSGVISGRRVALWFVAFFAVIIAVNLFMARQAIVHWTGLVVPNSYVASQQFNGKIAAHRALAALGLAETVTVSAGRLQWALSTADGKTLPLVSATVQLGRPVGAQDDASLAMIAEPASNILSAPIPSAGRWVATIVADVPGVGRYETVHRLTVHDGDMK